MEKALIGGLLADPDRWADLPPGFGAHCFWREANAVMFSAAMRVIAAGAKPTFLLVEEELRRTNDFDRIGGLPTVVEAMESTFHGYDVARYADQIFKHHIRREGMRVVSTCRETLAAAADEPSEVLETAISELLNLLTRGSSDSVRSLAESMFETISAICKRRGGELDGISTGFSALDDVLGGLGAGRMIILAGRPSMGKTALALTMAVNAAKLLMSRVLFVSQEMGHRELTSRVLSSEADVNGHKIQEGVNLTNYDMRMIQEASERLASTTLTIDDTAGRSVAQIEALARRQRSTQGLDAIFVDYVQLLEADPGSRANRQETVSKISRALKRTAMSLQVPVIVLSQLNRAVEQREDKRPLMSDLRESGSLEQDADQVVLIHRPEYYDPNDQPGITNVIVAKNRHGATGTVSLAFMKHTTTFKSLQPEGVY